MSGDGNLLEFKKTKGRSKKDKSDEISQAQLHEIYASILDHNHLPGTQYEPIDETYKIIETSGGNRLPLIVKEDKVCQEVSTEIIAAALARYWRKHYSTNDALFLNSRKVEQVVTYWLRTSSTIPEPKAIVWQDQDEYCYRRLPFTYNPNAAYPALFFELLERMSNKEAFCVFIGSLFYEESNRQQYVWIFGNGNNGKGALSRFLHQALADSYAALSVPQQGNQRFWNHQLLDIRLGFFNECSSPKFPTSAFFKTLTGNDPVSIEAKGQPIITAKIKTKFIFTSNERPALSNETADHRRAIICEIQEFEGTGDPEYEEKLWGQAQDILSYCCAIYEQHVKERGHRAIPVCLDDLRQYSAEEDDHFEAILNDNFILSPDDYVVASRFGKIMNDAFGKSRYEASQFRAWLKRNHGVTVRYFKTLGVTERRYPGIKAIHYV